MDSTGKNSNKVIVVLAVLIVLVAAAFVFFMVKSDSDDSQKAKKQTVEQTDDTTKEKETSTEESEFVEMPEEEIEEAKTEEAKTTEKAAKKTEAAEQPEKSADSDKEAILKKVNVESEVLQIRKIYNEIQDNVSSYKKIKTDRGTCYVNSKKGYQKGVLPPKYGSSWNREYYFEDGKLIFAFYYSGQKEERFYFYDEVMFRWIDDEKVTHDKSTGYYGWSDWERRILKEAKGAYTD